MVSLCGRATWAGSVQVYMEEGRKQHVNVLRTSDLQNMNDLNKVLKTTASPWTEKVSVD